MVRWCSTSAAASSCGQACVAFFHRGRRRVEEVFPLTQQQTPQLTDEFRDSASRSAWDMSTYRSRLKVRLPELSSQSASELNTDSTEDRYSKSNIQILLRSSTNVSWTMKLHPDFPSGTRHWVNFKRDIPV